MDRITKTLPGFTNTTIIPLLLTNFGPFSIHCHVQRTSSEKRAKRQKGDTDFSNRTNHLTYIIVILGERYWLKRSRHRFFIQFSLRRVHLVIKISLKERQFIIQRNVFKWFCTQYQCEQTSSLYSLFFLFFYWNNTVESTVFQFSTKWRTDHMQSPLTWAKVHIIPWSYKGQVSSSFFLTPNTLGG